MKILVLAGGADQSALIVALKSRGHYVVLIDYNSDPPAKKYADKHYMDSTLDVTKVLDIAQKENANIVTTACTDQALLVVAQVSEIMGLPCYLSYNTALNVTNKAYMKNVFRQNDIPSAKFQIIGKTSTIELDGFKFPLIVKPVDCNSSKGVRRIDSESDINLFLEESIELSRTSTAIIEEFVEGVEVSVDAYIDNGTVKLLSITNSTKIKNQNSFTILQSVYPVPEINEETINKIEDAANKIAHAFSLNNCPLLIQLIVSADNSISIIEFSARMGGGSKYYLIETISGVDIMGVYVDRILGGTPTVNPISKVNFATMNYIYCYPSTFDQLKNFIELKSLNIISEYFQYKEKGAHISKSETSSDRIAGFLLVGDTENEILEKQKIANQKLEVLDIAGNDMMNHSLFNG